jgi:phage internal scaffolding protein
MEFQKAYKKTKRPTLDTGPGLTEQSHKKETDMNYILKDYVKTGLIKHAKENEGKYDDIAMQDFQDAMFIVAQANSMFENLPGEIRKQFGNDPAHFLGFVQNPENKDAMEKMGILRGNDGVDINGAATMAPVEVRDSLEPTGGTEAPQEPK